MSQIANNPYLLNIIPIFNIADPTNGFTLDTAAAQLSNLGTMIDTTNHIVSADVIEPYTTGAPIRILGEVAITGSLSVNDVAIGPDDDGINLIPGETVFISTGTTGIEVISTSVSDPTSVAINFVVGGSSVLQFNACGNVLYDGSATCGAYGSFEISSALLKAPDAAFETISTVSVTAYSISTHSLTVWGSTTLTCQGSTILEGPVVASLMNVSTLVAGGGGDLKLQSESGLNFVNIFSTNTGNCIELGTNGYGTFVLDGCNRALYSGGDRFWVSSSVLHADRCAVNLGGLNTMSTIFDVWNGDAYFDGNVHVKNDVYCQNVYTLSDSRFKKDIEPLGGALSTICRLKGVRYRMDGRATVGFLAQEVQEVVPEAVGKRDDGALVVDYSRIVPILVEAVKELAGAL